MKKAIVGTLSAATVVASSVLLAAAPSSAAFTTYCEGEGGAVTVPGDLHVASGKSCTLTGTTIQGNVVVGKNADLIAVDVTVEGNVDSKTNSYIEFDGSTVTGATTTRNAFGSIMVNSDFHGTHKSVRGATVDTDAFTVIEDSTLGADLTSVRTELFVDGSQVLGSVNADHSSSVDFYQTFVDGDLRVARSEQGAVLCQLVVQGTARVQSHAGPIQVGADGPDFPCEGGSYVGGNLVVSGNTADVFVADINVGGKLNLVDNTPVAHLGTGVLARGGVHGDYNEWDGSATTSSDDSLARSKRSLDVPSDRGDLLLERAAERKHDALAEAQAAGDAELG